MFQMTINSLTRLYIYFNGYNSKIELCIGNDNLSYT